MPRFTNPSRITWTAALCVAVLLVVFFCPGDGRSQEASPADGNDPRSPLLLKEKRLQDELRKLDQSTPDSLAQMESIIDELKTVREQLRRLKTVASGIPAMTTSESMPPASAFSASDPAPSVPVPSATTPSVTVPSTTVPSANDPAALPVGTDGLYRQLKGELDGQLQQIRQMMRSIGPQETRLAAMLKSQEGDILRQLEELDRQMAPGARVPDSAPKAAANVSANVPAAVPAAMPKTESNVSAAVPSAVPVAEPVAAATPKLPTTGDKPVPESGTPMSWIPGTGTAPADAAARDPFAAAPAPEILEIRQMIAELKAETAALKTELREINTQLRLISHKIVGTDAPQTDKK